MFVSLRHIYLIRWFIAATLATTLMACTSTPQTVGVNDPYEVQNRKAHAFNAKLRGKGNGGLGNAVAPEFKLVIGNVAENLSMPQVAVNSLLQGDLRGTGLATYRFAVNTVVGIGGIIDVADEFDVPAHDTDFGETLHVWGMGEGAYLELPFIGPTTQRDLAGRIADLVTNPLSNQLPPAEKNAARAIKFVSKRLEKSGQPRPATYEEARDQHLAKRRAALAD